MKNKITIFQSPLYQTNATVIETDDMILLVDPTTLPHEIVEIRNFITSIRKDLPVYLLFTHSDWDHILGYNGIEDVICIGSEKLNTNIDKGRIVDQIKKFDDQYYLVRDYEVAYPKLDYVVFEDQQQLIIGGTTVTFYLAKGHTDDGIFAVVEPVGTLITGDYLSDIEFPYIYFSSYKYEETMDKLDSILKSHTIDFMIPGHGNPTEDSAEMMRRKIFSLDYIHELRSSVMNNDQAGADRLLEGWRFPIIMREFHEGNKSIMKKEIEVVDRGE